MWSTSSFSSKQKTLSIREGPAIRKRDACPPQAGAGYDDARRGQLRYDAGKTDLVKKEGRVRGRTGGMLAGIQGWRAAQAKLETRRTQPKKKLVAAREQTSRASLSLAEE